MIRILTAAVISLAASSAVSAETNWTGFYVGLNYTSSDGELTNAGPTVDVSFEDSVGLYAGYDFDFGQYVVGGELTFGKFDDKATGNETKLYQLQARIGADLGSFLPYVTVGAAKFSAGDNGSETGVTYGVGGDYRINDSFSVGIAYSVNNFENVQELLGADVKLEQIQMRASYRF